jgi:predicted transcriptional regulator|tara:strand:- start:21 stop:428 length:408 start_codon:yes stop_codon:yes gene_type:complete
MKEYLVEEIISETYSALDLSRKKSRETIYAQARAATAMALNKYFSQLPIASALGVDRSTISYYKSKHEDNLKHWGGYSKAYKTAESIADSKTYHEIRHVGIKTAAKEIESLEKRLKYLRKEKKDLESTNPELILS